MVLLTAIKLGKDFLRPALQEMDKNPPEFMEEWKPFIQDMWKKVALKEDYALNYYGHFLVRSIRRSDQAGREKGGAQHRQHLSDYVPDLPLGGKNVVK